MDDQNHWSDDLELRTYILECAELEDFKYLTLTRELASGKIVQELGHKLHIIETVLDYNCCKWYSSGLGDAISANSGGVVCSMVHMYKVRVCVPSSSI